MRVFTMYTIIIIDYRITNSDYLNIFNALYNSIYWIGYWYQPISTTLYRLSEYQLNLVSVLPQQLVSQATHIKVTG